MANEHRAAQRTDDAEAPRARSAARGVGDRDARPCAQCQAPAEQRVEAAGFGPVRAMICGVCGHPVQTREDARHATIG